MTMRVLALRIQPGRDLLSLSPRSRDVGNTRPAAPRWEAARQLQATKVTVRKLLRPKR